MGFLMGNISKLSGFPIAPEFPSLTTCRVTAGDASGVGLYVADFTSGSRTIATRQFSDYEMHQSSTFRECLVVWDVYASPSISIGSKFSNFQVIHITDNKGVVSIFTIGSPKKHLQELALDMCHSCNHLGIKLHFLWHPRDTPIMQLVDRGSRGP